MNTGKLEVVKQEMTRVNIDILGISELRWTGMGEFNSDDHYIARWSTPREVPGSNWKSETVLGTRYATPKVTRHTCHARLLSPWDFPGKNTGVGCHFVLQDLTVKVVIL